MDAIEIDRDAMFPGLEQKGCSLCVPCVRVKECPFPDETD